MSGDRRLDHLADMERAATSAVGFVAGMKKDEFFSDVRTQHAIGMCLIVIGEAAVRLIETAPDFVVEHSDFPWHAVRGLRNRIAHGYFTLDTEIIWETAKTTIPDLLAKLEAMRNWHAQGE
ncbi:MULTISPECIES: DUF86 domain-containing protein [Agrobacterium]|jgi:uncharacterized protein with HEPN domain|nr:MULTISPECIES: HepT-like ribonuclease domain-containing protein [Agrobacterium]MBB4406583.1 uncharacterized protein with HEPN domain [Agrobacterium radiobacter]MBB4450008.1 uncharacterized protein with HEPN domain [Agrobacterium radiobacter]MDR6589855.1 uncharacterized protein with HEPN domain [Agrobacterium tumefaciens]UNZ49670.1 DUF86 domain-containing protein [Agrobacterium tumefaciens]